MNCTDFFNSKYEVERKKKRKRNKGERDGVRQRGRLSQGNHHNIDSCGILLVLLHPGLWWGQLAVVFMEVPLLYDPTQVPWA